MNDSVVNIILNLCFHDLSDDPPHLYCYIFGIMHISWNVIAMVTAVVAAMVAAVVASAIATVVALAAAVASVHIPFRPPFHLRVYRET